MLYGRVPSLQKLVYAYESCTCIQTQVKADFLKMSVYVDDICRSEGAKMAKISTKNWLTLTLLILSYIRSPQNILKFFFYRKKSNLWSRLGPNFSFACYILYKLCLKSCLQLPQDWLVFRPSGCINSYKSQFAHSSCFKIKT